MVSEKRLLASDMDGTVIPLDQEPGRKEEVAALRGALDEAEDLVLAYVTGRDYPLALKGIRDHGLPKPDILVCDVGTSVFHATAEGFEADSTYAGLMREALGGIKLDDVRRIMDDVAHLELQPEKRQSDFKVSYYVDPRASHREVLQEVHRRLAGLEERIQTVYSVRARDGTGLLDLLPEGVAKDYAIHYLHDHTGVSPHHLVYAGDSGNDLAAMLSGFKVIVVGNAPADLKEELTREGEKRQILPRLYFAEHPYARGVLEGCRHFGVL